MSYPPAPWVLYGRAIFAPRLLDSRGARAFVPPYLDVVSVLPGKTLGGVYLAAYGPGSALAYHELIVVAALARSGGRVGFWISHIYVDDLRSMAGGREIWGLPKEMAEFAWPVGEERRVVARQDGRDLCALHYGPERTLCGLPVVVPAFSARGGDLLQFNGVASGRLGLGKGQLEVPPDSPLAALDLAGTRRTLHLDGMRLVAHAPRAIARLAGREPREVG
ncbi:MAG: acetoacetate decarboxylase family protein [Thermomicrobiaceae bacterium]|nr:acetoacetate decarboxylase family protein [Thermomicrobiaceae bacterium]